jgi:lipopolysaccharide heptosyltransferase I
LKILILKPSSLGDVVQALPVLRLLKRHLPASRIYWWLDSTLVPLLEGDPDLAGVIPFERRRWAAPRQLKELWRSVRRARAQSFDWVIDLQCLARSGALAWLANGRLLVGLDEPREGARGFYDVAVPRRSYFTHAVDWYLSVLPVLGVPVHNDFTWLPARPGVAAAVRNKWPINGARWIVLLPGARWPDKRWPAGHFAALVRQLAGEHPELRFAVLGNNEDHQIGANIAQAAPGRCLDLTGQTSLPELVEWVRLSALVVTNDTGPMHVAAALGGPVVALFGPTEPRRTGPYGQIAHVLQTGLECVPCMKSTCAYVRPFECLRAITPDRVAAEVRRRLFAACHPGKPA